MEGSLTIRFDVDKKAIKIIEKIVHRATMMADEGGWRYAERDAQMDLAACHCNGTPLLLAELLTADDFNFAHDVFGIRRNLDRRTGKLLNHFHPRYAKPERRAV
jgi:hypothetical protein